MDASILVYTLMDFFLHPTHYNPPAHTHSNRHLHLTRKLEQVTLSSRHIPTTQPSSTTYTFVLMEKSIELTIETKQFELDR